MRNKEQKNKFKKYIVSSGVIAALSIICTESALATFDLDAGIHAATTPLVALITKYYGVVIALGATGAAFVGQGDLRTRGINAGIGAAVTGGVVLALLKALT